MSASFSYFIAGTGFANFTLGHLAMLVAGCLLIYLAVRRHCEPLLLIPLGFGILIANIPLPQGSELISRAFLAGTAGPGTIMDYLYLGIAKGYFPALIFLGLGAMTDFSPLLSKPRLALLGAAAQVGIFAALAAALALGFTPGEAAAVGIVGSADGPATLFLASRLAPHLLAPAAVAVHLYIALTPLLQPPLMTALTSREERLIRMAPGRVPSRVERITFPVAAFLVCALIAPGALLLLGMFFLGNVLRESGVTDRLSHTARSAFLDTLTILVGVGVGAAASAETFLQAATFKILALGLVSFAAATAGGILFAKLMNLFIAEKINPLIGASGVSAAPQSARVAQLVCAKEDPTNFILTHAMGPNAAGVIGSVVAAGILLSLLGR
jgi:oxaloacetate decarboxylase beta subunit